jgi:hypothetical protein
MIGKNNVDLFSKEHFLFNVQQSLLFWKLSQDDEVKPEEPSRCKRRLRKKK